MGDAQVLFWVSSLGTTAAVRLIISTFIYSLVPCSNVLQKCTTMIMNSIKHVVFHLIFCSLINPLNLRRQSIYNGTQNAIERELPDKL